MKPVTFSSLPIAAVITALIVIFFIQATAGGATKPKPKQPAGGANQVSGANGKIGQMLFTGYWRFEALAVHTDLASYTLKVPSSEEDFGRYWDVATFDTSDAPKTFTPRSGYVLDTVDCLVKNGQSSVQNLDCWAPNNTALTDDQGQSYQPIAYDMLTDGAWTTKPMLQGSLEKLTVIFAVPPGTKLQGMVFTLKSEGQGLTKKDVRISLATPPAPK